MVGGATVDQLQRGSAPKDHMVMRASLMRPDEREPLGHLHAVFARQRQLGGAASDSDAPQMAADAMANNAHLLFLNSRSRMPM
jgi:hypothetical protein